LLCHNHRVVSHYSVLDQNHLDHTILRDFAPRPAPVTLWRAVNTATLVQVKVHDFEEAAHWRPRAAGGHSSHHATCSCDQTHIRSSWYTLRYPALTTGLKECIGARVNHPPCGESAGIEHSLPDSPLFTCQCRSWIGSHAPPRGEPGPLIAPCLF
jgi:hypothetical protein